MRRVSLTLVLSITLMAVVVSAVSFPPPGVVWGSRAPKSRLPSLDLFPFERVHAVFEGLHHA